MITFFSSASASLCSEMAFISGGCIALSDCAMTKDQANPVKTHTTALVQEGIVDLGDLCIHGAMLERQKLRRLHFMQTGDGSGKLMRKGTFRVQGLRLNLSR